MSKKIANEGIPTRSVAKAKIEEYLAHRWEREAQVIAALVSGHPPTGDRGGSLCGRPAGKAALRRALGPSTPGV